MDLDLYGQLTQTMEYLFGIPMEQATQKQAYLATCTVIHQILHKKQRDFSASQRKLGKKQVYYLSMEFLVGKSLKNNLFQLGLTEQMERALGNAGISLQSLMDMEPDAGLGNGGLGRLAACYLDAMANVNYGATGFSIRYEFGIFRQKIIDGWQMEFPDDWLSLGDVWLQPRKEDAVEITFGGKVRHFLQNDRFCSEVIDGERVLAVPYDMYIPGYQTGSVNTLTLWSATSLDGFDMAAFSRGDYLQALEKNTQAEVISKVLYPADDHMNGKRLRLRQQYLLVSASVQSILNGHFRQYGTVHNLPQKAAIHINDTHPALCVPELMRILLDQYQLSWEEAWEITGQTLSYTNHTVMAEALEHWPVELFSQQLPRIFEIVREIDRRLRMQLQKNPSLCGEKLDQMAPLANNEVQMANLCLSVCHKINGVSELHTQILKQGIFSEYARLQPQRFVNVTNGITYRRWLCQANPGLTRFLTDLIGPGFYQKATELEKLEAYQSDKGVLEKLASIKQDNKLRLTQYILKANGVSVDPYSIFDLQVKRLHEYKRQLLNILHVLALYSEIKENPGRDYQPRTFLFAAKASAGYAMAKKIISLIVTVSEFLQADPQVRQMLQVVFLEDYKVSLAEIMIPAAEISEQISVAGKEASGTGNMKLMLNGAVTLGTLDGANVEILEAVGRENMFVFGKTVEEAQSLWQGGYQPREFLTPELENVLSMLQKGLMGRKFGDIVDSLLTDRFGHADPYLTVADFASYCQTQRTVEQTYGEREKFLQMSLKNIAHAGRFSADQAIRNYGHMIWGLE